MINKYLTVLLHITSCLDTEKIPFVISKDTIKYSEQYKRVIRLIRLSLNFSIGNKSIVGVIANVNGNEMGELTLHQDEHTKQQLDDGG